MASAQRSRRRTRPRTPQATARWIDLAVAGLISLLGVAVWIETGNWIEARNLAQDPTVLPRAVAVIFWLVALGMVVRVGRQLRHPAAEAPATDRASDVTTDDDGDSSLTGALLALGAVCVYAWLAFRLGWATTTWLFVSGSVMSLGQGPWTPVRLLKIGLIAAAATAVVWFGFVELLNVRLPTTMLP